MPDPLLPHGDLQLLVLDLVKDAAHYAPLATKLLLGCLHIQHSLYTDISRLFHQLAACWPADELPMHTEESQCQLK